MIRSFRLPPSPKRQQFFDRINAPEKREDVLEWARDHGSITNARACKVGGWKQGWYHLNKLAQAGLLKRVDFNTWVPVKRPGRPRKRVLNGAGCSVTPTSRRGDGPVR